MDIYHKIERHDSGYLVLELDGDDSYHRRLIAYCTTQDNAILVRRGLDLDVMVRTGMVSLIPVNQEDCVGV